MKRIAQTVLPWLGALAALLFAVVLSFPYLQNDCGYDREVFRYMGMIIANGGSPYVDGFDHKPPLLYFFHALTHRWDPLGPWLGETALLVAACLALFQLARRRQWPIPLIYPIYFVALLRAWMATAGLTRTYSATFNVMAATVLLLELPYASLFFGLLFSMSFFLQQNDAMPLGILFLFHLYRREARVKELAWAALGAVIVVLPIFSWFLLKGSFTAFIDQAFLFNTRLYVGDNVLLNLPDRLKRTINDFGFRHWFMVAGILFAFLPRKVFWNFRELRTSWLGVVFLALFAEMVMMNISGVLYQNYFAGLLAWIVLFTGELFRVYSTHEILPRRFVFFLLLAALYVLPNPNLSRAWKDSWEQAKKGISPAICGSEVESYAKEVAGQRGQLYVLDQEVMHVALNRHYNIIMPTKWIYTHFWNQLPRERWDGDRKEFQGILDGLEQYKTRYIYFVDQKEKPPFLAADLNERWFSYLLAHYDPLEKGIWRRKPQKLP